MYKHVENMVPLSKDYLPFDFSSDRDSLLIPEAGDKVVDCFDGDENFRLRD